METNLIEKSSDEKKALGKESGKNLVQYIVVKIGTEQYGIDIKYVDNIVRMQKVTRVPKIQPYMRGVINLRGEIIAVMSLRLKMELPMDEFTNNTRIIILKRDSHSEIGVLVDEVKEVVTLDEVEVEKVFHDLKDNKVTYISGIGKHEGGLISLLDVNIVIEDKENA